MLYCNLLVIIVEYAVFFLVLSVGLHNYYQVSCASSRAAENDFSEEVRLPSIFLKFVSSLFLIFIVYS